MTQDPYETYRAAFGAELQRVAPKVRTRRRRSLLALGGATVGLAAVGTAAVVLAPTTGTKLDVLAQAQAAIAEKADTILHFKVSADGNYPVPDRQKKMAADCKVAPAEVWQTTGAGPPRYRLRFPLNPCSTNPVGAHIATGAFDVVYGQHKSFQYSEGDGFLSGVTDVPTSADKYARQQAQGFLAFASGPGLADSDGQDPVAVIRGLLVKGQLTDGGEVTGSDGRKLRRLTGHYLEDRGNRKNPKKSPVDVEYLVDAETFAPVKLSTTRINSVPADPNLRRSWEGPHVDKPITSTAIFETYETLPLNADTEKLLTVDPKPGTVIDTETYAESQARTKYPKPDAAEKARAKAITDQQIADGIRLRTKWNGPNGQ